MGIVQSSSLSPTFFSDFIYWLNYINHTLFQKKRKRKWWGEAWSEESSSLLNMCPGNNLLFSFPGSVFSLQTIKQERISSPRQSLHPQQIALHGERGSSQFTFPNALYRILFQLIQDGLKESRNSRVLLDLSSCLVTHLPLNLF